jgi:acetyl-CoA carboxylase biotin carboxyl carrier protein|tara:strand:- start:390 stop:836 length:447 start_codon:yes stop_codon:yes gene_type:complete
MATKDTNIIDKKAIKELVDILDEMKLTEVSYQKGDMAISVSKGAIATKIQQEISQSNEPDSNNSDTDYKNDPRVITSPMVGTVYLQAEPGANKFVNEGDQVRKKQTVVIIEAMKTMNPIESTLQGKVLKIFVENEEAVEFGQPIMLVE